MRKKKKNFKETFYFPSKKKQVEKLTPEEEIEKLRDGSTYHMEQDTYYLIECDKYIDRTTSILIDDKSLQMKFLNEEIDQPKALQSSYTADEILENATAMVDQLLNNLAEAVEVADKNLDSDNAESCYQIGQRLIAIDGFVVKTEFRFEYIEEDEVYKITDISENGLLRIKVLDYKKKQFYEPLWIPAIHMNKIKKIREPNIIHISGWDTFEDDNYTELYNGYYIKQKKLHEGRSWYKMEHSLRHIKWQEDTQTWYFANHRLSHDSTDVDAKNRAKLAYCPSEITYPWYVEINNEWIRQDGIKITAKFYHPDRKKITDVTFGKKCKKSFVVGDLVRMQDLRDGDIWEFGVVTSVQPLKVRYKAEEFEEHPGFVWDRVKRYKS